MNDLPAVMRTYIEGLKTHDVAKIATTVADHLAFIGAGRILNKMEFLAFLTAIYIAFPDWHYEHDEPEFRDDGSVAIRWRQGGTHSGPLALAGMPNVAPTGKTVQIPEHYFFYRVKDDRIVEIRPEQVPGGAPRGIFEQIGVNVSI